MSDLAKIYPIFQQRLGFNTNYLTPNAWEKALKKRMQERKCDDLKYYVHLLITDHNEFQAFTDLIVVPETWFFRDQASFDYLRQWTSALIESKGYRIIRILSLPCSTGEEPYSIAMALHLEGIPSGNYVIEGVDISNKLLEKAAKGVYSKNSFRGRDLSYRERYFSFKEEGYVLSPAIRRQVYFRQANALDLHTFPTHIYYDVIFCRNLFIYLHQDSQKRLLRTFAQVLTPNGLLILSPSELELARCEGFEAVGPLQACAMQHGHQAQIVKKVPQKSKEVEKQKKVSVSSVQLDDIITNRLRDARKLADEGHFNEAINHCHSHLKIQENDPEAFYLLGVIYQALGQYDRAESYFNKTIYLKPDHQEALVYLALIMEKKGDKERGGIFRQRAKNLSDHPKASI